MRLGGPICISCGRRSLLVARCSASLSEGGSMLLLGVLVAVLGVVYAVILGDWWKGAAR